MEDLVKGKGTFWEIRPGYYKYRFSLGKDPETGKYRYSPKRSLHCKSKNKRGREAELRAAMERYRQELNSNEVALRQRPLTVGEYADQFHELRRGTLRSALSYKREELDIKHIKEMFGTCKLPSLSPLTIKRAYAEARKGGRFSESELHKAHSKLSQIMKEAVRDELILKNPCEMISVPRPEPKERYSLSPQEASRFFRCLHDDFYRLKGDEEHRISSLQEISRVIGTLLLLDTGMRRGEMLGLSWRYVDFKDGTVYICQQYANDKKLREPKSRMSRRRIHLSSWMADALNQWKTLQEEYFRTLEIERDDDAPIVSNERGCNTDPNNYDRWFRSYCAKNGFGSFEGETKEYYDSKGIKRYRKTGYVGLTPHGLRHTHASALVSENCDIKTVQARLGHSSVNLTLNIYAHAVEGKDREAADVFSKLIQGETDTRIG